jgi:hypothetical protein
MMPGKGCRIMLAPARQTGWNTLLRASGSLTASGTNKQTNTPISTIGVHGRSHASYCKVCAPHQPRHGHHDVRTATVSRGCADVIEEPLKVGGRVSADRNRRVWPYSRAVHRIMRLYSGGQHFVEVPGERRASWLAVKVGVTPERTLSAEMR